MNSRNRVFVLLTICYGALLVYTSYRAGALSFTHDESISYDIVTGNVGWKATANHHPLNTRLMTWANRWLGANEWQLRLPNVLSHVLYVAFGLLLLIQLRGVAPMLVGFAILNLDPFLLDFFSLARGYGLALGLSMAALYFLWRAWRRSEIIGKGAFVLCALICGSLADLANYTWLNSHLPLFAASLLILLVDRDRLVWTINRWTILVVATLTVGNALFIRNVARRILSLQKGGELYGRGESGFLTDTVGSLVDSYYYNQSYPSSLKEGIVLLAIAGFMLSAAVVIFRTWQDRRVSFAAVLMLMLALAVVAPIMEHHLLGAPYPIERIALYYVPLAGVLAMFLVDENLVLAGRTTRMIGNLCCALLVGGMTLHFSRTANLSHTMTWAYDAETRNAMLEIGRYFASNGSHGEITVGNNWVFEPAMNYYRKRLPYDWLSPVKRAPVLPGYDVVYCFSGDVANLGGLYHVLKSYPDTGSVLLVREPNH